MRVLLVSNMYAYPGNWDKLDELGQRVTLGVVMPSAWHTTELHPVRATPPKAPERPWKQYRLTTHWQFQGNPFRYVYHPAQLIATLQAFQPDLVHVEQEPESLSLLQLSWLKRQFGYRLVFVAWENIHPLRLGLAFRQVNFRAAEAGIVGNQAALERLRQMGFRKPLELIPQYSFEATPQAGTGERPERPFTVGYAGRLVPEKGLATLIALVQQQPDLRVRVAGAGPLAAQLQAIPQFELLGTLPRSEMQPFWDSLDVLVVPSLTTPRWAEQFGRVIVEAMAAGVPVIGSSSGAIPEVIAEAGLIFPEGDAVALAALMRRLRDQPATRAELVARGLARVQRCYSSEVIMGRTVAFYHAVLGQAAPTPAALASD